MDEYFYNSPEWAKMRSECFRRDGYRCVDCGSIDRLHAHHLSTFNYKKPDLACLVTLCNACHVKRHDEEERAAFAAMHAAGVLVDGAVYSMHLTDARIAKNERGSEFEDVYYIRVGFSRFISGKFECSTALFNENQIIKFLATCGIDTRGAYIDTTNLEIMERVRDAIDEKSGVTFNVRVRASGSFWNVKPQEVFTG